MTDWNPSNPPYVPGQGLPPTLPAADSPLASQNDVDHWAFRLGLKLHNLGYHWEAHEIWESLWTLQQGPSKEFLKILIQITAAHLKLKLLDYGPAERLIQSASAKLKELSKSHEEFCGFNLKKLGIDLHSWASSPVENRPSLKL